MADIITNHIVDFYELEWDTHFFGVSCAKAVLYGPLDVTQWKGLKSRFERYEFVSIENRNSDPVNAQLIGRDTSAFLTDVNIQLVKKLTSLDMASNDVRVYSSFEWDDQLLKMARFQFSKFTEDPGLLRRGGDKVYEQWISNSFGKGDKFFAISATKCGVINGFLLHSYSDDACVVELIAVSSNQVQSGIGTKLFNAVANSALRHGFDKLRVGTQVRNVSAINFYHKVGCKQIGCHQVYHLWNT